MDAKDKLLRKLAISLEKKSKLGHNMGLFTDSPSREWVGYMDRMGMGLNGLKT